MLGNGISPTSLAFNCGFARVAVRELTETQRGQPQSIDKEKRAHGFKELFERPSFLYQVNTSVTEGLHESLVSTRTARRLSEASQRNETHREKHVNTIFSIETWNSLNEQEKTQHTLSKCKACATKYKGTQESFPLKPVHEESPTLEEIYTPPGTSKKQEAKMTRQALQAINTHHIKKFGKTIIQSAIQTCPEENVQRKPTQAEKKQVRQN